jgi:hypothetical protein
MLNNEKLVRRLKKIFIYLRDNWGITFYRITVESKIPYSSLKYMMDGKFEWKLNHLLSIVDFLNRNNVKVSLEELLNFDKKIPLSKFLNTDKADFKKVIDDEEHKYKRHIKFNYNKPLNFHRESEELAKEIVRSIKESPLFLNKKISVGLKISSNNFDFHKDMIFVNGKKLKD